MKLDLLDLDELQASLPEPMQVLMAEARASLFRAACEPNRKGVDGEEPDFWMDDDFISESVNSLFARIGGDFLSSTEFWSHYEIGRKGGLEIIDALKSAIDASKMGN